MFIENSLNLSPLPKDKLGTIILSKSMLNAYINQLVSQEETENFFIKVFSFSVTVNEWCEQRQNPHHTAHKVNVGSPVVAPLLLSSGDYMSECMPYYLQLPSALPGYAL